MAMRMDTQRIIQFTFHGRSDRHMEELVKGASIALFLKVIAAGLSFLFNIVLARMLGAEDMGRFLLALSVTAVATVLGLAGLGNTLTRFTAAGASAGDWCAVKGAYRKGIFVALLSSIGAAVLMALASPWLARSVFSDPKLAPLLGWMSLAVVPMVLVTLYFQLLKGLKRVRDSIMVVGVLTPLFALLCVFPMISQFGVTGAIWAYCTATMLAAGTGMAIWHHVTPQMRERAGCFEWSTLFSSCVPLFWTACCQMVLLWAPTIILGILKDSQAVGIFGVANRTAMLTSYILIAVDSIAAPKFSALYSQGDLHSLGRLARSSGKMMTLAACPLLLLFLLVPKWILHLFGPQFSQGSLALSILAIGQFINVATGSVGNILIMCGRERLLRNATAFSAIVTLILSFILIPIWGFIGAAIAASLTLIFQNLLLAGFVWARLGISSIPFLTPKAQH
jgi:O-antigen/teichoic acid export membrane protein